MTEAITTTTGLSIGDDGILRITIFEGAKIELKDIRNHYTVSQRITNGKKVKALIDARAIFSISMESRAYAAGPEVSASRIASAILVNSFATKFIINLYITFNKPVHPVKIFSDETLALAWLNSISKK
jgi:hypothetical protein